MFRALNLSQYEKIVRSYKTGEYVPLGDFDAKSCGVWVKQYNKNFDDKAAEWWDRILQLYDVDRDHDQDPGDMSILDGGRAALPMSSP
jgi:hypothetical protein